MVQADHNTPALAMAAAPQWTIRRASVQDVEPLSEVLMDSFYGRSGWHQWVYPFIRLGIQEDLRQRLKSQSPRYACFAAVQRGAGAPHPGPEAAEGAIAGTVEAALRQPWPWQGDRHVYISNLAVSTAHRRQGIAVALLQSCERAAQHWQVRELQLHVMEDNLAAQALYRRAGFRPLQAEDTPGSWLGLQARRLLLVKTIALSPR
jgi:ribosomal protein S18 acetylase RimI-like enzyme